MDANVVLLAGLTPAHVALLAEEGVNNIGDLLIFTFEDYTAMIPGSGLAVRRKLSSIAKYLAGGDTIDDTTTMQEVMGILTAREQPVMNVAPAPVAAVAETVQMGTANVDLARGAPKISVNAISVFSGEPFDWEVWERSTSATIGQTVYSALLTNPVEVGNLVATTRNNEFYNMLLTATQEGEAAHVMEEVTDKDGHKAWVALQEWYGTVDTSRTVVAHYTKIIENLRLDDKTSASKYINTFILCCQKLKAKGESYTTLTKREKFLQQITDTDYDVVVQTLSTNKTKTFDECVKAIRSRESDLDIKTDITTHAKARRGHTNDEGHGASLDDGKIPSIPASILYKIQPIEARQNLIKWRGIWNTENREIRNEELKEPKVKNKNDNGQASHKSNYKGHDTKTSGKRKYDDSKRKARRTSTVLTGSKAKTARVGFKEPSDSDDSSNGDEDGDDDSPPETMSGSSNKKKARATKKKKRRNPKLRRGRVAELQPKGIIDPGTDFEVLGGVGWMVVEQLNRDTQLDGAFAGMSGGNLPVVVGVTAVDHPQLGPVLLGVGAAAWDERAEQTESLLNSHELRKHNVVVEDKSIRDGGLQLLEVDGIKIDLIFEDERILYIPIRRPTQQEYEDLEIHWLIPRTPDSTSKLLARRNKMAIVPEQAPWDERLGNCPEAVTAKTLLATTQLCSSPVEMENRETPRQHRKSRILPLHPKRITGRTDSDTFFSSVKSVRGFTCVQLFISIAWQFLYVTCMRRESHSHGAYQDFIRNVGAPNTLLTDNAQTQVGTKWMSTSRANATKHVKTVPHNQQQNQAERKVGLLKSKTILTLRYANAPLVFWCYCLQFLIECLNHTAHSQLDWRTPMEFMHGHTPDISMFRFTFWEPIWYFEPTAKYPKPNFLPGRCVGIAWDHGDAFTYKVWTTPNNDWEQGQELIRNVVRSRHYQDTEPKASYEDSDLEFEGRKLTRKQQKENSKKKLEKDPPTTEVQEQELPAHAKTIRFSDEEIALPPLLPRDAPPLYSVLKSAEEPGGKAEKLDGNNNSNSNDFSAVEASDPTSNLKRARDESEDDQGIDYNPLEEDEIEMTEEVNNDLSGEKSDLEVGGARVVEIVKHSWFDGQLKFKVKWNTEESTWETFRDMKEDHPRLSARYIVENNVTRSKRSDRNIQWAKKTLRDMDRAVRRVARLYDFYLDNNDEVRKVRRAQKGGNKKKKQNYSQPIFKYGVQVPRNVRQAIEFDKVNGDTFWQDAIKLEVNALNKLECFEFKPKDFVCGRDFQKTTLTMIFDVKHDLRRKARLVAGGHLIDALDVDIYSSTVKSISVKLLHVIAHKKDLKQLCGDVSNAFPTAYTNERVYAVAGPEFGTLEGHVVIIRKALYGLRSSSERWHAHFADTLRSMEFVPTRYDKDVWMRKSEDETYYEYVCTHVDDFMIVSRKPEVIMEKLKEVYSISSEGPPEYYLGNDYKTNKGRWAIGCKKYLVEAVARVQQMFGSLKKYSVPLPAGDHPEMDTSELLNDDGHRKYQMLVGMLNWVVTIGRFDIAHATSSMSRFSSCPRKGHLDRLLRIFGYLKKRNNRRYVVDSRNPIFHGGEDEFGRDYAKEFQGEYPDAVEEIDQGIPDPLVDEMEITVFVDSDHAHDKMTRRSITGIMIFVGRTPVFYSSKRQGAVETSTYGAEFCAMRTGTEETISVRYMLRCLGVKVEHASYMFGDNLGVVQNATIKGSLLKKKHVAISFHRVREATAAGIVHPMKIDSKDNYADVLTKSLTERVFCALVGMISYG